MKITLTIAAWLLWISGKPGWSVLAGAGVILLYLWQCIFWPYAFCTWCRGSGKWYRNEHRKHFRECWWCNGRGRRLRIIRRLWNRTRVIQKNAR